MDASLSQDPRLARVDVIGVPITATNMADCMALISERLDDMRGGYVCVSNAHTCVMAHDDPAYWAVQAGSTMSVPDGKPLSVVGSKAVPTMGRVTGPDLMREVFSASAERGWSHYFYGNRQENLEALRDPRQEVLMAELMDRTRSLMVGVGGAFNILAGVTPEAPQWMQDASLEWLYRLIQEPGRLIKRYATTNTKFIWYQLTNARRKETRE